MIDNGGHAVIRVHAEEIPRELITALDIDGCDFVREPTFLQEDGDLLAVGRGPIENLDHPELSFA
jgi:hypothetical protein